MNLCQYKYMLGYPNKKFHKHFFGFAIGDLILTVIISFMIMLGIRSYVNFISNSLLFGIVLLVLLFVGELLHYKFCLK